MHLWPTKSLRDSFKLSYLTNLEWNYRKMKSEQQSPAKQTLLDNENQAQKTHGDETPNLKCEGGITFFCQELLLLLSCCYCCFCCGACVEEK